MAISKKASDTGLTFSRFSTWFVKEGVLLFTQHQQWFEALRTDDLEKVTTTLCHGDKKLLLHGTFEYDIIESEFGPQGQKGHLVVTRPFNVAAVYRSTRVLRFLVEQGVDVTLVDEEHYNVVHCLIASAFYDPEQEVAMVEVYNFLRELLPCQVMSDLLLQENKLTLRPLEMAAQVGAFQMMRAVMATEGVYLARSYISGMYEHRWYDITEYETHTDMNRRSKSPILFIALLDKSRLAHCSTQDMFRWQVIQNWINSKTSCNMAYITVWCLWRILYVFVLYIQDSDNGVSVRHWKVSQPALNSSALNSSALNSWALNSSSSQCVPYMYFQTNMEAVLCMNAYLSLHSLCILLFDLYEVVKGNYRKMRWLTHDLESPKELVVHLVFYRAMQFLMALLVVAGGATLWAKLAEGYILADLAHILLCVSTVWSLLFFVQLLPSIGHFVIVVQRMLQDMFNFTLIFIFFFVPFTHAFYRYLTFDCAASTLDVYYETFTIMLNMADTRAYMLQTSDPLVFMLLHMLYVFIVAILLVNFLVALMSNSVAEVANNRQAIITIQRISVVLQLEDKLGPIALFRRFYQYKQRQHFLCANDKIYLVESVRR